LHVHKRGELSDTLGKVKNAVFGLKTSFYTLTHARELAINSKILVKKCYYGAVEKAPIL
jgi:hypothetical protein